MSGGEKTPAPEVRPAPEFDLVPLDPSGPSVLSRTADLFRVVWPDAGLDTAQLEWSYRANPDGPAIGCNAVDREGRVVGHYAVQPMRAVIDGREERGALSLNTAVHPDFRGRGLFQKLAKATYQRAADEGSTFIVGVANAMSAPLFWKVFKFQAVGPMDVWAGLGSPSIDTRAAAKVRFCRSWTADSLAWRLAKPGNAYRSARAGSEPALLCPAGPLGIQADLGSVTTDAASKLPAAGPAPLRVWAGLDPRRTRRAWGRVPVPVKWRPSPLHVIFKDLTSAQRRLDKGATLFQLLDFDAY
jgi:GNAT superfamily N-acetyltransferase